MAWVSDAMVDVASGRSVERWGTCEIVLDGPHHGNPFVDVAFGASFRHESGREVTVTGFYDGDGVYRLRFMPDAVGEWRFVASSSVPELDGHSGRVEVVRSLRSDTRQARSTTNHGPVPVAGRFHFAYADGTPYRPVGTTVYDWVHERVERSRSTPRAVAEAGFTKLRFLVMPQYGGYCEPEPELFPFDRHGDGSWDFTRFDPRTSDASTTLSRSSPRSASRPTSSCSIPTTAGTGASTGCRPRPAYYLGSALRLPERLVVAGEGVRPAELPDVYRLDDVRRNGASASAAPPIVLGGRPVTGGAWILPGAIERVLPRAIENTDCATSCLLRQHGWRKRRDVAQ